MNEALIVLLSVLGVNVALGFIIWFIDAPVDSCKKIYRFCNELISKTISRILGVMRLCLVVGILLVLIMFIKIPVSSGIGQIVCGKYSCHIFGEPCWTTAIIVFCTPFVIAKIINFVISGFNK